MNCATLFLLGFGCSGSVEGPGYREGGSAESSSGVVQEASQVSASEQPEAAEPTQMAQVDPEAVDTPQVPEAVELLEAGPASELQASPDGVASEPGSAGSERSETCVAPPGVSNSPTNYTEFAALINSLPLPTSLECFLSSLRRPLGLFASYGAASAQPARGIRSPRTFLFSGPFIYSIVPDEEDGNIMEFSLLVTPNRSVKGELEFPLLEPLDSQEMDRRLNPDQFGNVCGGCHRPEVAFEDEFYLNAFESSILEPDVGLDASLETVRGLWESCDPSREPLRCGLFSAIFEHGPVRAEDFIDATYSRAGR